MAKVLGLDIGGANTKATFLGTHETAVESLKVASEYFPIWKRGRENLPGVLERLRSMLAGKADVDGVGVTMTAELSDAYWCKTEGVNHILDCVERVFQGTPIHVVNVNAELTSAAEARQLPLNVAAANWAATGWMVSRRIKNCLVIDVGSTTTSIIPVIDGRVAAKGKLDLEKLANGELVYTGVLRTNVATVVNHVPLRGRMVRVSSELFASTADVYLILGEIEEGDYTVDTSDGRGKTRLEAMARLARVPCADIEMLGEPETVALARYVARKQVGQVAEAIDQVCSWLGVNPDRRGATPAVVTGLGEALVAGKAARESGFTQVVKLSKVIGVEASLATPAFATALMVAEKLSGGKVGGWWKQS